MHAASTKMVQVNTFAGQEERHRCRDQIYGPGRGRGVEMNWEIGLMRTQCPELDR